MAKPARLFEDPQALKPSGGAAKGINLQSSAFWRSTHPTYDFASHSPFGIQGSSLLTSAFADELTGMPQKSKKGPRFLFAILE